MANSLDPVIAHAFVCTVLGWPNAFSAKIEGERVVLDYVTPVKQGEKRPELIDELLNSDVPLTKSLKQAISKAQSPGRLGRPRGSGVKYREEFAIRYLEMRSEGVSSKQAYWETAAQFAVPEKRVKDSVTIYNHIREWEAETYRLP